MFSISFFENTFQRLPNKDNIPFIIIFLGKVDLMKMQEALNSGMGVGGAAW
jgi:hypothetical protein